MVLRASKKRRGVARVLRAATTGRARTVSVAAGPHHATPPAPPPPITAAGRLHLFCGPLFDGEHGIHRSARLSNRT